MSITTWGWGSCGNAIGTWGWAGRPCIEYVPHILADYLANKAYTCVLTRDRGNVLLRLKPDQIPERVIICE